MKCSANEYLRDIIKVIEDTKIDESIDEITRRGGTKGFFAGKINSCPELESRVNDV